MFFAYAVVTLEKAYLFIDPEQVDASLKNHLGSQVEIRSYADFTSYLRRLADELKVSCLSVGHSLCADASKPSLRLLPQPRFSWEIKPA